MTRTAEVQPSAKDMVRKHSFHVFVLEAIHAPTIRGIRLTKMKTGQSEKKIGSSSLKERINRTIIACAQQAKIIGDILYTKVLIINKYNSAGGFFPLRDLFFHLNFGSMLPWALIRSSQRERIWSRVSSERVCGSIIAAW